MRYKPFAELCVVPNQILDFLNNQFEIVTNTTFPDNNYHELNLTAYKQWFMQKERPENELGPESIINRWDYTKPASEQRDDFPFSAEDYNATEWKDTSFNIINDFFGNYVNRIFRFRFSLLKAPYNVEWHQKHKFYRIHIPLNDSDAVWELKEEKDSEVYTTPIMEYGKAYLVDVTLLHRVVSKNTPIRKNSFFCFDKFATDELERKYSYE